LSFAHRAQKRYPIRHFIGMESVSAYFDVAASRLAGVI
jgi:hypothetical protein